MLIEHRLGGEVVDKVADAIAVIREHEPPEGYYVAFSGGKDSIVCLDLVKRAGVKWDAHFHRALEPPELIYFIRRYYPDVTRHLPKLNYYAMIRQQGIPPLRTIPYCCRILKEMFGNNRVKVMGIRRQESRFRKNREIWDEKRQVLLPIAAWTLTDVWSYIRLNQLPYPSLYDEGFKRLGCVMCPKAGSKSMRRAAKRWHKIALAIRHACRRAYDPAISTSWASGDDMYEWWVSGKGFDGKDRLF
jgi:phosphoadenosine phosphosulfate reductase